MKDLSKEFFQKLANDGCTYCGCTKFAEGPSGGMSTNFYCIKCGHGFNVSPDLGLAQDLEFVDERYIDKEATG
jgi:hypothetical protein